MRILAIIAVLLSPVLASADQADAWLAFCRTGSVSTAVTLDTFLCFQPIVADNNDETPIIDTTECTNGVDVWMFDDVDGDGLNVCTVAWQAEFCPANSAIDTNAERDAACAPLLGIMPLAGDDQESNLKVNRLRFTAGGAGVNPTGCRIEVRCGD